MDNRWVMDGEMTGGWWVNRQSRGWLINKQTGVSEERGGLLEELMETQGEVTRQLSRQCVGLADK